MGDNSAIEWTDATWNPIAGCSKVSPGCRNCYAIRVASRFANHPNAKVRAKFGGTVEGGNWTGKVNVSTDDGLWSLPLRWRRPRRIFVNSESDLFHEGVPFSVVDRVFAVMALCPRHTFQILTKRPKRMREYFGRWVTRHRWAEAAKAFVNEPPYVIEGREMPCVERVCNCEYPLPNVWLGVSVEDQATADARIPDLLATPAAVRFLSCEPLLGPVELHQEGALFNYFENGFRRPVNGWPDERRPLVSNGIAWVIAGGESGPAARPMHPTFARSLRDQCLAAGVPFHFKQWGEWRDERELGPWGLTRCGKLRIDESGRDLSMLPGLHSERDIQMVRVGKKAAGRVLDGRTWDEFPGVEVANA